MAKEKDKTYDFGRLGKWSESTLKAQAITHSYSLEVEAIELIYTEKTPYKPFEDKWYSKRWMRPVDVECIIDYLEGVKELNKDYIEYKKVLRKIMRKA